MAGAVHPAEVLGKRRRFHEDTWRLWIALPKLRSEYQIGAAPAAEFQIGRQPAGVSLVVFLAVELERVYENGDDHAAGLGPRPVDQRAVPGVQGPHGGDQADAQTRAPGARDSLAEFPHSREHLEAHADSLTTMADRVLCSSPGKLPRWTSSMYSCAPFRIISPRLAYCFTNLGTKRSNSPNAS